MRKARMVVLAYCSLACMSLPERVNAQFFAHSYAIVIGIDHYAAPKWPTLGYAVKDAQAMAALLGSQGFTVISLYESQATKEAILSAMQDNLAPRLGTSDRVLVFFAGHGQTETLGGEKRGYIVPYDGDQGSSLISMAELQEQSSLMGNAKHELFIMDSCYGGLLAAMRDSVVDTRVPNYLQVVTDRVARQVLTAGGEGQEVVDGGPKGHSVFMDALLEGLQDGLADLNGDGYITFHELVVYVTPRASNVYQTPGDGVLPGHQEGEFLFLNPKGSGRPVSEIPVPYDARRRNDMSGGSAEQHLALGNSRWPVGDWDGAIKEYREALRLNPNYAEGHDALGAALVYKGDWDGAITEEHEALRLKPDYAEAHQALGVALSWKGDRDGAIREQREALRLKPDYAEAHRELGMALGWKGDWDGVIREEHEALRLKPDDADAHETMGIAREQKGDTQSALAEYRRALELKPGLADAQSRYDALLKKTNSSPK